MVSEATCTLVRSAFASTCTAATITRIRWSVLRIGLEESGVVKWMCPDRSRRFGAGIYPEVVAMAGDVEQGDRRSATHGHLGTSDMSKQPHSLRIELLDPTRWQRSIVAYLVVTARTWLPSAVL